MSFWRGVANVLAEKDQQDYETRERQKERDYRTLEKKEDRAYEEKMFMKEVNARRQESLAALLSERQKERSSVTEEERSAQAWALSYFSGVEGAENIMAAVEASPSAALRVQKTYNEVAKTMQENRRGDLTPQMFAGSLEVTGITNTTPEDVLSYQEIFNTDYTNPEDYYRDIGRIPSSSGDVWDVTYDYSLSTGRGEDLFKDQEQFFKTNVDNKLKSVIRQFNQNEIDEWRGLSQAAFREQYENFGPEGFYDMLGYETAQELRENEVFQDAEFNPSLQKYFNLELPSDQGRDVPSLPSTQAPTLGTPEAMEIPPEISNAMVVPKEVSIDGQTLDISNINEVDAEIISESGAVPYLEWRQMSRTERERAGLPTSEIGGQIRYANRDGSYDFVSDGWELVKRFAESLPTTMGAIEKGVEIARNPPKISDISLRNPQEGVMDRKDEKGWTGNLKPYQDTNSAFASEILIRDIKNGRVSAGDRVLFNGEVMEMTQELIDMYLGES